MKPLEIGVLLALAFIAGLLSGHKECPSWRGGLNTGLVMNPCEVLYIEDGEVIGMMKVTTDCRPEEEK